jgi:RNA polymerase sigma factor (TIGR02999 family)
MAEEIGEITRLLRAYHEGDREGFDRLVPLVYKSMRRIARGQLARAGRSDTLDTTSLVHETYLQLKEATGIDWRDRSHFFAVCARAMRFLLVDYARERTALKRGAGLPKASLDAEEISAEDQAELVLAVNEALERLGAHNPRLAQVVECRYFAGMTEEETAAALDSSLRTVQRDWMRARAWLRRDLGRE